MGAIGLEFRILGELAIARDGTDIPLGGSRARQLVALLVVQRSRPLTTDAIVDRLWPDEPPATATKTVQVYVSRLRAALGPHRGRLMSAGAGYGLRVDDGELDAQRFESALSNEPPSQVATRQARYRSLTILLPCGRDP